MYEIAGRVRYSEVGIDQHMTPEAAVNYFQDCSTFHSEDIGLGVSRLAKRHRVWVLSAWQIIFHRFPLLGEQIRVQTWPYGFHGFMGDRNFQMLDENDKQVICANSLWTFLDTDTGHPVKVEQTEIDGYVLEPKLTMDYAGRKITLQGNGQEQEAIYIKKHQIDTNYHVNNCQYISIASDMLPKGFIVKQIRVEYKKSAALGDKIVPVYYDNGDRHVISLCDEKKSAYAIVEFIS